MGLYPEGFGQLAKRARLGTPLLVLQFVDVVEVVVSLRPRNRIGWLCLVPGVLALLLEGPGQLLADRLYLTVLVDWQENSNFGSMILVLLPVTLVLLIFPTGRLPSRRWRFAGWVAVGSTAFAVLADYFSGTWVNISAAEWVGFLAALIAFLISVTAVILRWRRSMGQERQQLKWLAYAVAVTFVAVLGGAASWYVWKDGTGDAPFLLVLSWMIVMAGVTVGIPVAIGVAILKHRLYDIDRIINRTLVYGLLTALLVVGYFGSVLLLARIGSLVFQIPFQTLTGQKSTLAVVASTLAIAALFNPLRRRIQSFVDRRFYRRKYDAAKTLQGFSTKLRDETDLNALNEDLVKVVRETMQPAHVSLWLHPDTVQKGEQKGQQTLISLPREMLAPQN